MLDLIDIVTASFFGPAIGVVPAGIGAMLGGASTPLAIAAIVVNPAVVAAGALAAVVALSAHRSFGRPKNNVVSLEAVRARRSRQ